MQFNTCSELRSFDMMAVCCAPCGCNVCTAYNAKVNLLRLSADVNWVSVCEYKYLTL